MFLDEQILVSDVLLSFGKTFRPFRRCTFLVRCYIRIGDIHYVTFVPCPCEGVVHGQKFVGVQRSPVTLTCFSVVVLSLFLLV